MDAKRVMSFRGKVLKNDSLVLFQKAESDGTIEKVSVRFYPGQELSVQIVPFVKHHGQSIEQMIKYVEGSDQFLSGNDDYFVYDIVIPIQKDDEIYISAKNTDLVNDYNVSVDVSIDYYGGTSRIIGGAING